MLRVPGEDFFGSGEGGSAGLLDFLWGEGVAVFFSSHEAVEACLGGLVGVWEAVRGPKGISLEWIWLIGEGFVGSSGRGCGGNESGATALRAECSKPS